VGKAADLAGMRTSLLAIIAAALAVSAHAKPIVITAFPYTIVAPGNYQVASYLNIVRNTGPGTNITINVTVPGKVVLDLNGVGLYPYSIDLQNTPPSDCVDVFAGSDITIENGGIAGGGLTYFFSTGIYVNAGATGPYLGGDFANNPLTFAPGGSKPSTGTGGSIGTLTIKNVSFRTNTYGIILARVSGATIKNCNLAATDGPEVGIWDYASRYGNTYINNAFSEVRNPLIVTADFDYSGTIIQQRTVFATPAPTPTPTPGP
jgi:hypothetical protein